MSTDSQTKPYNPADKPSENDGVSCFDSARLSHAYITGKPFAGTLATAVVCSVRDGKRPCFLCSDCSKASRNIHPDIITIDKPDDKLIISVDQIRELKKDVYIVPNDAMQKAYVINNADSMNTNAQNAFLQILEEPPAHVVFILCTNNPAALLPTVRSRCVELKSLQTGISGENETDLEELSDLISDYLDAINGDNVKLMECMFRIDKLDRHLMQSFLIQTQEQIVLKLRDLINTGSQEYIDALINAEEAIVKAEEMHSLNVSSGHIAGLLCAKMINRNEDIF